MDAAPLSLADLTAFDPDAPARRIERRFLCPLCHGTRDRDDAHRSLSANVKTGVWWCHRCEAKGLLIEFRDQQPATQSKPKRRQRLAAMPGSITQPQPSKPEPNTADRGYDYDAIASHVLPIAGSPAAAYLEGRGIPIEAIPKGAKVRYMPAVPALKIRESVAFGLSDSKGETIGLQLRNIEGTFKPIYKRKDVPHIFATPRGHRGRAPNNYRSAHRRLNPRCLRLPIHRNVWHFLSRSPSPNLCAKAGTPCPGRRPGRRQRRDKSSRETQRVWSDPPTPSAHRGQRLKRIRPKMGHRGTTPGPHISTTAAAFSTEPSAGSRRHPE